MSGTRSVVPRAGEASVVVAVQNDFLPGGPLALPGGEAVILVLNAWIGGFCAESLAVFATRDRHPPDRCSFAAQGGPWPPRGVAKGGGRDSPLIWRSRRSRRSSPMRPGPRSRPCRACPGQISRPGCRPWASRASSAAIWRATTAYALWCSMSSQRASQWSFSPTRCGRSMSSRSTAPVPPKRCGGRTPSLAPAVRLHRGKRAEHGRRVRAILDRAGLSSVGIFASGRLAGHDLAELIAPGPPVDGFGVGSRLDTSADAPCLDCACKIQDYAEDAQRAGALGASGITPLLPAAASRGVRLRFFASETPAWSGGGIGESGINA